MYLLLIEMLIGEQVGTVVCFTGTKRYRMEKISMKRRMVTIVLAMILCFGFVAQDVEAASCPPHNNTKTFAGAVSHWTTEHKVYRNLYIGNEQVYSICTISHEIVQIGRAHV